MRPDGQFDIVLLKETQYAADASPSIKLIKDQPNHTLRLFVRIEDDFFG
jgi:hypothetical protein